MGQVLCAANAAAADSIGMECCYAVADAVLDALSHVNDSAIECCICLAAVLPEELSCAYTGSCFHSFHGDCIFGWVRTCRTSIEAERSSQETPIHRHLSACRGDVGNKVCSTCQCQHLSVMWAWLQVKFANDVSDQLESVKNDIAATQAEVESYKLSLAVADDSIVAAAASRLKELEKVLSALLLSRDSLKAKLRSARQKVEEAEARLGRESAKLLALTASSKPMLIPCPVCRLPLPWDPPQEAGYGLWLAAQVDGAPSPPTDSTNLLEALDADTRAYVLRFREHVAAVTAAQREAGGQIDPAGTPSLVVGAPPPPPPTVDPPPTMDDH